MHIVHPSVQKDKPLYDDVVLVIGLRSHGKRKKGNIKCKICTEKRLNTSLKDLSIALNNHGRHGLFSFLSSMTISVLLNLE